MYTGLKKQQIALAHIVNLSLDMVFSRAGQHKGQFHDVMAMICLPRRRPGSLPCKQKSGIHLLDLYGIVLTDTIFAHPRVSESLLKFFSIL